MEMSKKSAGLGAAYGWFAQALALCRAHPRVLFGSASLLMMVALLPTILQLVAGAALQAFPALGTALQVLFSLTALVLMPPAVAGFYRIVQALDQGRAADVGDLFVVFKDAPMARRLILINLVFLLLVVVLVVGLAMAFGGQELLDFFRTVSTLQPGSSTFPPFPDSALALSAVLVILALLVNSAKELAALQAVLGGRLPGPAIGEGLAATLRNAGALLAFYLPMMLVGFVVALLFGVLAALIGMAVSLISPGLAVLLVLPLAMALVLVLYGLIYTFFYFAWQDTLGEDAVAPGEHQIAA